MTIFMAMYPVGLGLIAAGILRLLEARWALPAIAVGAVLVCIAIGSA